MHQEVVLEKGFERDHQPMLAHEILLRIAHYIENGIDFMKWIQALKEIQYPSMGDLGLILDLQELTGLDSSNMWPCLNLITVAPSEEIALMIANVCQFFKKIDFFDDGPGVNWIAWYPVYISRAISSLKPYVVAGMNFPNKVVPLTKFAECQIKKFGIMEIHSDDEFEESEEDDDERLGLPINPNLIYESLCEHLKNIQGLETLLLCEVPSEFLDTFFQQMHSFGISKLVIWVESENRSIANLASALRLKKLNSLSLGGGYLDQIDMDCLSPSIGLSQLKELCLYHITIDDDDDDDDTKFILQLLTDGLVNSIVEIVTFDEVVGLELENIKYLMENLCNMKSLKKLYIQGLNTSFYSSDIPFLVQCARETTADIFIQLGVQPLVNLQDLVRMQRQ